ncbi:hypothetical protein Tco_0543880 [Tanacetum coccineum]|uniref:CCHC-type domain-containing protein n=1 Tax=Tanacetum coccineum TaxID=301880 RepID=A0ABQ5CQ30_9ASTR
MITDTWAMEMNIIFEYIDNEVWKVIQNGNSKSESPKLLAFPKDHLRRFHGMDDAKRSAKSLQYTVMGGNATRRKCKKATIQKTSSSSITSDNVAFLSQAKASSSKHKPSHSSGSTNADDVIIRYMKLDQMEDLEFEDNGYKLADAMTAIKGEVECKGLKQEQAGSRLNWNQQMERELGAGYSFERKPCFVCGSLSHLIKNCDYYEKKMAREAALKSQRVVMLIPVQLSNIRPNLSTASKTIKTGRVNVNTGHGNVNSGSVHVNSWHSKISLPGASIFNTGNGQAIC